MAAMLSCSRVLFLPCTFSRSLPKASWIRSLSSDSSENGNKVNMPLSSLMNKLKHPAPKPDLSNLLPKRKKSKKSVSVLFDNEQEPLASRPKQVQIGEYDKKVIEKTEGWRHNKILREMRDKKSLRPSGDSKSGDLLGFMRESPVEESTGKDNLKSMLEESIESTRRHKKETFKNLAANRTKSTKYTSKPAPNWVEKSLEDLQNTLDNQLQTEPLQKNVDPALNQQIKDLLSELHVAPKQFGTATSIVASVENWGKLKVFSQRRVIQNEYQHQTNEILSLTSPSSGLSLLDGERTGLFDDIISRAKTGKLNTVAQSTFLFHLEDLDKFNRVDSIGVKRSTFTDQIMLSNRLWQYPIDNEVCKVEEQNTSFEEHVFLEYLLDDFPSKGPVRRFMELVINGLQQNPYMTVKQKKERVHWFHEYFANFSEEELNF